MSFAKKSVLKLVLAATTGYATLAIAQSFPIITSLPPLEIPEAGYDEAAMAELGSILFFDPRLSGDSSTSCASCHSPTAGWGDSADLSRGYPGTRHWRNAQTLVNAAYLTDGLHWDGTVPSLEEQVPGAMGTSVVANIDPILAEERLRQIPEYVQRFDAIWGDEPTLETISMAIAAFERTLVSNDSPFDLFSQGEVGAFSAEALRGLAVFQGPGNCISCHNGPLATDGLFYNTSVPPNPSFQEDPLLQVTFRTMMRGFGIEESVYQGFDRDPGRYLLTRNNDDLGTMRTPPLRYLRYTAPYMHNGVFYTLQEVVEFYNNGGTDDVFGTKSNLIQPLNLTAQQQSDLVAFLESMSGTEVIVEIPDLPDYDVLESDPTVLSVQTIQLGTETTTSAELNSAPAEPTVDPGETQVMTIVLGAEPIEEPLSEPVLQTSTVLTGPTILEDGDQRYVVVAQGDTLGTLAEAIYGDVLEYRSLYEANRAVIENPLQLEPGLRLIVPDN